MAYQHAAFAAANVAPPPLAHMASNAPTVGHFYCPIADSNIAWGGLTVAAPNSLQMTSNPLNNSIPMQTLATGANGEPNASCGRDSPALATDIPSGVNPTVSPQPWPMNLHGNIEPLPDTRDMQQDMISSEPAHLHVHHHLHQHHPHRNALHPGYSYLPMVIFCFQL